MKTITIYELLVMIKEGKELPKKIKYDKHIYEYQEGSYDWGYYNNNNGTIKFLLTDVFNSDDNILSILNDEVKILEEEKKIPEKLGKIDDNDGYIDQNDVIKIGKKVDKIIDYLDYLKSKGE